jgi:acyl-CoA thioester hydrolase
MNELERFDLPLRVRYSETDQMGQAYYANYLVWFEAARGHLMRELGLPYGRLEEEGFLLPVTRFAARLVRPARYDDDLRVRLWVTALRSRGVSFVYHVLRAGELLAEGSTEHVSVDRAGRPVRLPDRALELLGSYRDARPAPPSRRARGDQDPS